MARRPSVIFAVYLGRGKCSLSHRSTHRPLNQVWRCLLLAWLLIWWYVHPQIETYGRSCSFMFLFYYFCSQYVFFHKRFYSKNTREQNETHIFYLGNVNTAVVRNLIQEIDLTSYNDEGSLLCVVYRGLVSHQTEVKFIFQVWFDFYLNPFDNHLFICISLWVGINFIQKGVNNFT